MSHTLVITGHYKKLEAKFLARHPELREKYLAILRLQDDPASASLRRHRLKGRLKHLEAVSITISYRITMQFRIVEREIILISVGSHDDAYR